MKSMVFKKLVLVFGVIALFSACRNLPTPVVTDDPISETIVLEAPLNLDVLILSQSSAKLFWTNPTSTVDFSIKILVKEPYQAITQFEEVDTVSASINEYTIENLNAGVEYDFRVQAVFEDVLSNGSNIVTATTFPIGQNVNDPVPYNFVATPALSAIGLSWQWSNNQVELLDNFKIERRTLPDGNWGPAGSATYTTLVSNHNDGFVISNYQFEYRIKVYYTDGFTYTSPVYGPVEPLPSQLPAPTNIQLTNFSYTPTTFSVTVDWDYNNPTTNVDYFHTELHCYDYVSNQTTSEVSLIPAPMLATYLTLNNFNRGQCFASSNDKKFVFKVQAMSNNQSLDDSVSTQEVAVRCTGAVCMVEP